MHITLREAQCTDVESVAELFDQYRQFYAQAPDLALARQFIGDRLRQQQSVILVAELADGALAGFCQLYPTFCSVEAQPIYALYDLFVRPDLRKLAVGRRLLLAAEARAAADGKARNAVIYFGGNAENIAHRRQQLSRSLPHSDIYMLAYRGYGASEGEPTITDCH